MASADPPGADSSEKAPQKLQPSPKNAFVPLLRASRLPKEYKDAVKVHKCGVCVVTKPRTPLKKVSPPKPYIFNHEVEVDVVEVKDVAGTFYDIGD